ncbi:MAG: N-acetylneuraminate synthase family protein, partial [Athalassotoga sp.]|uniref:N-acetylneuraminate synthase family protein n=1 Tax=Athalassotoga sp. TaxID=2022597 RepID=UPI003CFD5EE8
GKKVVIAAAPCSVESKDQLYEIANIIKKGGASILRGGAFKPRTSPYSFQGLGKKGIDILKEIKDETGMPILTEILDIESVKKFENDIDIIQVGSRNGQNFSLLQFLGKLRKPILLKNGMGNTV